MNIKLALTTAFLALLMLAPLGAAHPSATPVDNPATGGRCYIYTNDTSTPEFWRETNGERSGGVPEGAASHIIGGGDGTGLQRGGDNPDTRYDDAAAWAADCLTS